jgi:hypothetical protein
MKRSTASTKRSGWRGYGDPAEGQDSSSSASSSEYGSPAAKSPREASAASDQSQANFDFSGLDQTFAGLTQTPTHDLTGGVGLSMKKRGAKGQYDLVTHERAVNKLVPIDLIADQVQQILPMDITKYPKADLEDDQDPRPQVDAPIETEMAKTKSMTPKWVNSSPNHGG